MPDIETIRPFIEWAITLLGVIIALLNGLSASPDIASVAGAIMAAIAPLCAAIRARPAL